MSKLRDRIREMSRRKSTSFGFTVARDAERPVRQVLVMTEVSDSASAMTAVEAGADVLLHTGGPATLGDIVGVAGSCVVGLASAAATAADAEAVRDAGAHFLVFDDRQTDSRALLDQKPGYVAMVGADESDADLRLLRPLDLEAAIVAMPSEQMTVREQLRLRRTADLVRKPLVARVDRAVEAGALEIWRDAGVVAVLVSGDREVLAATVAAADAVPRPREASPSERREVTLPSVQAHEDEDDED